MSVSAYVFYLMSHQWEHFLGFLLRQPWGSFTNLCRNVIHISPILSASIRIVIIMNHDFISMAMWPEHFQQMKNEVVIRQVEKKKEWKKWNTTPDVHVALSMLSYNLFLMLFYWAFLYSFDVYMIDTCTSDLVLLRASLNTIGLWPAKKK